MVEQTWPSPSMPEPKAHLAYHRIEGRDIPMTLVAGPHWFTYDGSAWTVNADESATEEEVTALLAEAGGVTMWWG